MFFVKFAYVLPSIIRLMSISATIRQALSGIRFLETDNVVARYMLANMRLQSSHPTLVRMLQCLRHVTSGTRELFREVAGVASLYIIL